MKIVIISDIHGNFDALSSLPEDYDELWVLGDLVNYGPQPREVVDFVLTKATLAVCGNHDQCIGRGDDPRCSSQFREMAEATRQITSTAVTAEQKAYLGSLPPRISAIRSHSYFFLCHATPSDPLYEYRKPDSEKWVKDCSELDADFILVGHTHIPFVRYLEGQILINPGSLGQPKTGSPDACYAVWEDGRVSLRSFSYPVERTVEKIRSMPIARDVQDELIAVLQTGGDTVPPRRSFACRNTSA